MLLKHFMMLLSMMVLFFQTDGGAGGDSGGDGGNGGDGQSGGDGGDGGQTQGGDGNDGQQGGEGNTQGNRIDAANSANSVNRQIKDFARERGITVEALLDQFKTFEDSNKTELQRREDAVKAAESRAERWEREAKDANGRSAIYDAATKAGAISPKAVYAMARDALEFDDDGKPTNVDDVMAALQKDEAQLFKHSEGRGDGGAGGDTQREVQPGLDRMRDAYEQRSKKR